MLLIPIKSHYEKNRDILQSVKSAQYLPHTVFCCNVGVDTFGVGLMKFCCCCKVMIVWDIAS